MPNHTYTCVRAPQRKDTGDLSMRIGERLKTTIQKGRRNRAVSQIHTLTNMVPKLRTHTKPQEEDNYFTGLERKPKDAFFDITQIPAFSTKTIVLSNSNNLSNRQEDSVSYYRSDNDTSTKHESPYKPKSGTPSSEEVEWLLAECTFDDIEPRSEFINSVKNYDYNQSAVSIRFQCSCPSTRTNYGGDGCGKYCKFLGSGDQIRLLNSNSEQALRSYEFEYAIASDWWQAWWDFVNVEFDEYTVSSDSSNKLHLLSKLPGYPVVLARTILNKGTWGDDDIQLEEPSMTTEMGVSSWAPSRRQSLGKLMFKLFYWIIANETDDCHIAQLSFMLTEDFYERPGMIKNVNIWRESEDGYYCVKDHLQEPYDYVRVNEKVWKYLKKWFGCDYEVWMEFEAATPLSYAA